MADEQDKAMPPAGSYAAGDLVRDSEGNAYLVSWPNTLPNGTVLDTIAVLALRPDLETVYDYLDFEVSKVASCEREYLSFDETRTSFWTYMAANL